jgi:hypothetical protein
MLQQKIGFAAQTPSGCSGAHGADRTRDLSLTKGVLYH